MYVTLISLPLNSVCLLVHLHSTWYIFYRSTSLSFQVSCKNCVCFFYMNCGLVFSTESLLFTNNFMNAGFSLRLTNLTFQCINIVWYIFCFVLPLQILEPSYECFSKICCLLFYVWFVGLHVKLYSTTWFNRLCIEVLC